MNSQVYTCTCLHSFLNVCMCVHAYEPVCMRQCARACIYAYMHVCVSVCVCVCVCVCMCVLYSIKFVFIPVFYYVQCSDPYVPLQAVDSTNLTCGLDSDGDGIADVNV